MNALPTDPVTTTALAAAAVYLMVAAGLGKKLLVHRVTTCTVCHNPRTRCTCRWL